MAATATRRTRPTIDAPIAPVTVTQDSAPIVLGISPRRFRELVNTHAIRHVRLGKLVIVKVADMVAALEGMATTSTVPEPGDSVDDAAPIRSVDEILATVGRRRIGGGA